MAGLGLQRYIIIITGKNSSQWSVPSNQFQVYLY